MLWICCAQAAGLAAGDPSAALARACCAGASGASLLPYLLQHAALCHSVLEHVVLYVTTLALQPDPAGP